MMLIITFIALYLYKGQCLDLPMLLPVEDLLDKLCPSVDICNINASNAELLPNGLMRENTISCCTGCSCHPDCIERSNCCYPNDNSTFSSIKPPTIKYECLHSAIGNPGEALPDSVEAYHTVVMSPAGGCVSTDPVKIEPNLVIYPSCEDDHRGRSYFPVYSKTTGEIYKNIQCALCHGIKHPQYFSPMFICLLGGRLRTNPFSEISYLIDADRLSSRCHVYFRFNEPRLLSGRRCYHSVIDTCQKDKVLSIPRLNIPDLDINVVKALCETSVYSPFPTEFGVFKNVFCYLCGHRIGNYPDLECRDDSFERTDDAVFISLLDPRAFLQKGATLKKESYPEACHYDENEMNGVKCYRVYCPLGKAMNNNGKCVFVSNYITSPLQVYLKLTPVSDQDFRLIIRSMDIKEFENRLTHSIPWSNEWMIKNAFIREDDFMCKENAFILVDLVYKINSLSKAVREIENTLGHSWKLVINGTDLVLKQSLREYDLRASRNVPNVYHIDHGSLDCDPVLWKLNLYLGIVSKDPVIVITKLYLCSQIQIKGRDFNLQEPKPSSLKRNVTKRVLAKLEFELIIREDGYQARICLEDTILTKRQNRNSGTRQEELLAVLFIVCCNLFAFSFETK